MASSNEELTELRFKLGTILEDEEVAAKVGEQIAAELHCCRIGDRYACVNGNRTAADLARTVARILGGDWN